MTGHAVNPREVFGPALLARAASVVVVHNHPSGDPALGVEDGAVARRLRAAGELLGVRALDFLAVGQGGGVGPRQRGSPGVTAAAPLPVSVLVPHMSARRGFFADYGLPSIRAARPAEVLVDAGEGSAPAKRNRLLRGASQPLVFWCDDDVVLGAGALAACAAALAAAPGAAVAYGHYVGVVLPGGAHPHGPVFVHRAPPWDAALLRRGNYISTMSLVRRDALGPDPWDETLARFQDWALWLDLAAAEHAGVLVDRVLFLACYLDAGVTAAVAEAPARAAVLARHGGAP